MDIELGLSSPTSVQLSERAKHWGLGAARAVGSGALGLFNFHRHPAARPRVPGVSFGPS